MAITNEFAEAVQSENIMRVRIMLKDSLLLDPTAGQFQEMEQYAMEKLGNIYTEHDGEKLNFDVTSWNEDYLNEQMVAVIGCFSKERVELLKSMVRFLYKEKADKIRKETSEAHVQSHITRKQVGVGVSAAGVVLTAAGICTSHTLITIGGVAAVAAGIVLIVSDKEGA